MIANNLYDQVEFADTLTHRHAVFINNPLQDVGELDKLDFAK